MCVTSHTTPHTHTHQNHNQNHSHTRQRQRQRHTTNLQLHSIQHGKTHQPQTQQGLTDSSFFGFNWWCMAVFSVGEVICLATPFNDRDLSLLNHVKYDSLFDYFLERPHPQHYNFSFSFSDLPINKYMTITITVYFLLQNFEVQS